MEEVAVAQGASAAALEWAKQNAVGIAEERMRATFLDELLAAEIADEQAWIRRGSSLNYDLAKPHVAVLAEASGVPDWPAPLLRSGPSTNGMANSSKCQRSNWSARRRSGSDFCFGLDSFHSPVTGADEPPVAIPVR